MPFGDGTGPAGTGPMTGRAVGYCAGYDVPGYMNPIAGRGFWGRGRGGGRGRRNWFYATGLTGWQRAARGWPMFGGVAPYAAPFDPAIAERQELEALRGQAEHFARVLDGISKRIQELEATAAGKQSGDSG